MKKILIFLLSIVSLSAFGQAGSQAVSGIKFRVNDTTTYQTAVGPAHSQGYSDIYWNNQATTPHWDIWNGSSYDHVFDFNGGSGGSDKQDLRPDHVYVSGTTYTPTDADAGKIIHLTNSSPTTVTLATGIDAKTVLTFVRDTGAGLVTFVDDGTSSLLAPNGETLETELAWATWIKDETLDNFYGVGSLGPASSGGGTWGSITGTLSDQTDLQSALDAKQDDLVSGTNIKTVESQSLLGSGNVDLDKGDVGLGNVDNTSDANKPVSTAQQTAIDSKVSDAINDGTTTIAPSQNAVFDALALKAPLASPALTGIPTAPTASAGTNTTQLATTAFVTTANSGITYYLTPEMYSAAGDGVTNDATAFNNLMAAASSQGLPVRIPAKTYLISSTVTIPSNVTIYGAGAFSILTTASNIPIFTITSASNIHIYNLTFDGTDTGATQRGIYANGNVGFTQLSLANIVHGCIFRDFGADGAYVNFVIGSSTGSNHEGTFIISDCIFESNSGNGVNFDTRGEYNQISNCKFYLNGVAIRNVGGNNSITGCSITDNTTGILIGAGTNDGHAQASGNKINHNGSNVTCTSTATGYMFIGNEIISGSITVNAATDIRFDHNDIDQAPITLTNAVRCWFRGNYFRQATPSVTVASGSNPLWDGNYFTGTVHSTVINTMQGGIQNTQQGPTSPSIETSTWTTTASGQFANKLTGTITPRATASDITQGAVIDYAYTATANNQVFYQLDVNRAGTLATGGFTGTTIGAARFRGRFDFVDLTNTGAVTGTSGIVYTNSSGTTIFQYSPDGIYRGGNAGSPWQFTSTSDGSAQNNNGNGFLMTTGAIGANFGATNSGAGTVNARGIGINGGSTISSGTTSWFGVRNLATHNQTGTATGNVGGFLDNPTVTSLLGTRFNFVSIGAAFGGVGQTSESSAHSTWHINGSLATGVNTTALTTNTTLDTSKDHWIFDTTGGNATASLPDATTVTGRIYTITNISATNTLAVDPNGTQTINGSSSNYNITGTAYSNIRIQSAGSLGWIIIASN